MRKLLPNPFMPGPIDQDAFLAALPAELVPRENDMSEPQANVAAPTQANGENEVDQSFLELLADLAESQDITDHADSQDQC